MCRDLRSCCGNQLLLFLSSSEEFTAMLFNQLGLKLMGKCANWWWEEGYVGRLGFPCNSVFTYRETSGLPWSCFLDSPWHQRKEKKPQAETWKHEKTTKEAVVSPSRGDSWLSPGCHLSFPQACISWSIHHLPQITNHCSITSCLNIHSLLPKAILMWEDAIALAKVSDHLRPLARAIWEENTEKKNSSDRLICSDH